MVGRSAIVEKLGKLQIAFPAHLFNGFPASYFLNITKISVHQCRHLATLAASQRLVCWTTFRTGWLLRNLSLDSKL